MLVKKYQKARLLPNSKIFFQLGLALSLLIVYVALEWKTVDRYVSELNSYDTQTEEVENIPITERIQEVKPPPPPPPAPEKIEIVADKEEIIETVLETTETDESDFIEVQMDEIEEVVEDEFVEKDVPFAIIEEVPIYPGCKGTNAQKKKCMVDKITKHVSKHFNTGLSQDLGLSPGKKKVYVQFRISKTGQITDVRARGPHKRLEKEGVRVVKLLPSMTPGKQRSRPVGVSYTLPITLIVQN